jgi:arginase
MGDRMNLFFPLCIDAGLGRELYEGSWAMRRYLSPSTNFDDLDDGSVCDPAIERGVVGYAAIVRRLARAREQMAARSPDRILAIGGGCGIEVAVVDCLLRRYPDLKVIWLDAHGDLNSPASSPSGHFHGMPLRFLMEDGLDEAIRPAGPLLAPEALRYLGLRSLDPPEAEYIEARGIRVLPVSEPCRVAEGWETSPLYVHLDLDVLDPEDYPNVKCPEPGGLGVASLAATLRALAASGRLVGMSVLENTATGPERLALLEGIFEVARSL